MTGLMYVAMTSAVGVLLRCAVSMNSYSGENDKPMFGDYEAQRHWMEITHNLPIKEWYVNSTNNDLQYWGLDYPPLTGYHSALLGAVANNINSTWVELFTSRGLESKEHKVFMRNTVLISDLLVYFPAVFIYSMKQQFQSVGTADIDKIGVSTALLTYPGLILIDHGHFQYNCVSLGLALLALAMLCSDSDMLGSVAFVLALNYKQMELYHACPIFCYLFGSCFCGLEHWFLKFVKLGSVVLATFTICWLPFLHSFGLAHQVLHRLFPFSRGLYEDKVANVWCSISIVIKLKKIFTEDQIIKLCFGTTILMLIPTSLSIFFRPTKNKLKIALINSALIFFLFSFQVHEKSILLAALPVCAFISHRPFACVWFLLISVFSMTPLFIKDGLVISAVSSSIIFYALISMIFTCPAKQTRISTTGKKFIVTPIGQYIPTDTRLTGLFFTSMVGCAILTIVSVLVKPPQELPDLFSMLISIYSCGHFLLFLLYFQWLQVTWVDLPASHNVQARSLTSKYGIAFRHSINSKLAD